MIDDKIASKIVDLVKTREDLLALETDIAKVESELYKSTFKLENLEGKIFVGFFNLLTEISNEGLFPSQIDDRERLLKSLQEFLQTFNRVGLTLAFSPSEDFVSKLSHWVGSSIEKPLVLDILVKPEIGGGLILETAGNYRDYSIAENLSQVLSDKSFVTSLLKLKIQKS